MGSFSGGRSNSRTRRTRGQGLVGSLLATALFAACGPAAPPMPSGSGAAGSAVSLVAVAQETPPRLRVGRNAWVAVSVATVWRSPDSPREVDAPALTRPARITEWLAGMTTSERRSLWHRSDSQALLGDRVRVVGLRPGWAQVVVPSQPSPLDSRGYPGWVPRRQLTAVHPTASRLRATVLNRSAWLKADRAHGRRLFQVSFGTRLPVVGETAKAVRVAMPDGAVRRLAKVTVTVHDRRDPALPPTRRSIVRTAKSFLGLDYLWAGTSGFGFDCSGLMWLDYRVHGLTIPRDALPESRDGTAVSRPRRGDLLFFATDGVVHHVAMYVGRGRMVHSPGTGRSVEVTPLATPEYASEYAGSRRYLP
jgi:cell wall-associated NlpC family hydrolase